MGEHLEQDFAHFGIGRPLNGGVGARLGKAQILGASVDVHGGNLTHVGVVALPSPILCHGSDTLCKIETLLLRFGGQCCISATVTRTLSARSPSFQDLIRTGDDANCRWPGRVTLRGRPQLEPNSLLASYEALGVAGNAQH